MRITVPSNQLIGGVMILWSRGKNTADMAKQWHCPEALVMRALIIGREREREAPARADQLAREGT